MDRVTGDHMGMLATLNALNERCIGKNKHFIKVMSAIQMSSVVEHYDEESNEIFARW